MPTVSILLTVWVSTASAVGEAATLPAQPSAATTADPVWSDWPVTGGSTDGEAEAGFEPLPARDDDANGPPAVLPQQGEAEVVSGPRVTLGREGSEQRRKLLLRSLALAPGVGHVLVGGALLAAAATAWVSAPLMYAAAADANNRIGTLDGVFTQRTAWSGYVSLLVAGSLAGLGGLMVAPVAVVTVLAGLAVFVWL